MEKVIGLLVEDLKDEVLLEVVQKDYSNSPVVSFLKAKCSLDLCSLYRVSPIGRALGDVRCLTRRAPYGP